MDGNTYSDNTTTFPYDNETTAQYNAPRILATSFMMYKIGKFIIAQRFTNAPQCKYLI